MEAELGIKFPIKLENPHVVPAENVWVGVLGKSPSGCALNSSLKTRENPEYLTGLGQVLINVSRIVPAGVLVFFPSYSVLVACVETWTRQDPGTAGTIWESIEANKKIFLEPKFSKEMHTVIAAYNKAIEQKDRNGAMFFAVARGKVSEGLDFSDDHARAVVVIGLPYPNLGDPKVRLKYMYFDALSQDTKESPSEGDGKKQHADSVDANGESKSNSSNGEPNGSDSANGEIRGETSKTDGDCGGGDDDDDDDTFDGALWYTQQAMRAVNQSVGRVIRHINDYGAIILCDERFAAERNKHMMSAWLRPSLVAHASFGQAAKSLTQFFRAKSPTPAQLEHEERIRRQVLEAKAAAAAAQQRQDPGEFVRKIKAAMDKESYKHFMWLIRSMVGSAQTAPEKLPLYLKELRKILLETDNEHLFPELIPFLPAKMRDELLSPPPPKVLKK